MPNAFETPWVTLEVNDVPLSLCNDLGRPNLGMISWSSFFTTSSAFSVRVGKPSVHPVNVSIMTAAAAAAAAKSLQSCPTLCNPIDGSSPGSPIPGDSPGKNTGVGCHFLLQ